MCPDRDEVFQRLRALVAGGDRAEIASASICGVTTEEHGVWIMWRSSAQPEP